MGTCLVHATVHELGIKEGEARLCLIDHQVGLIIRCFSGTLRQQQAGPAGAWASRT